MVVKISTRLVTYNFTSHYYDSTGAEITSNKVMKPNTSKIDPLCGLMPHVGMGDVTENEYHDHLN